MPKVATKFVFFVAAIGSSMLWLFLFYDRTQPYPFIPLWGDVVLVLITFVILVKAGRNYGN